LWVELADRFGPLNIKAHDDIGPALECFPDVRFRDAFVVLVDDGVFKQFVVLNHLGELLAGDEIVVHSLHFPLALRTRGGSDHKVHG
jgi:hypothetical protein